MEILRIYSYDVIGTSLNELRCLNSLFELVVGTALLRARYASGMGSAPSEARGEVFKLNCSKTKKPLESGFPVV